MSDPTPENSYAVYCHTCNGEGKVAEEEYPERNLVSVKCPECNGQKFVYMRK